MATVRVTVTHPTQREDGTPGAAAAWQLQSRPDAAPQYGNLGPENGVDVTTRNVGSVPGGRWWFRAVWRDAAGGPDVSAEASVDVPMASLLPGAIAVVLVP